MSSPLQPDLQGLVKPVLHSEHASCLVQVPYTIGTPYEGITAPCLVYDVFNLALTTGFAGVMDDYNRLRTKDLQYPVHYFLHLVALFFLRVVEIAQGIENYDAGVTLISHGAEPIPRGLLKDVDAPWPLVRVLRVYGRGQVKLAGLTELHEPIEIDHLRLQDYVQGRRLGTLAPQERETLRHGLGKLERQERLSGFGGTYEDD